MKLQDLGGDESLSEKVRDGSFVDTTWLTMVEQSQSANLTEIPPASPSIHGPTVSIGQKRANKASFTFMFKTKVV